MIAKLLSASPWLILACLEVGAAMPAKGQALPDASGSAMASTSLNINWLDVQGVSQPPAPDQTGVDVVYKLHGKEISAFLPVEADTYLWKDSDDPQGDGLELLLRDNRYSEGLIKLHLEAIPKEAQIVSAVFRFKVQAVEKKGLPGTLSCFRVLTPWSESATWSKPKSDQDINWNGLQSGKDFAAVPFSQLQVPVLDDRQAGGQMISIPGFEKALELWRNKGWDNQGFLITLDGKAIQFAISSRESAKNVRTLYLGGDTNAQVIFTPNLPLFSNLLIKPGDLLGAQPQFTLKAVGATASQTELAQGELKLYAIEKEAEPSTRKLLARLALKDLPREGSFLFPDLSEPFRAWVSSGMTNQSLLLTSEGGTTALQIAGAADPVRKPMLALKIHSYPPVRLFNPSLQPQPGVYTKVVDGHLNYDGKRLRLWGVIGHPNAERLVNLGFNAERLWEPVSNVGPGKIYSKESAQRGEFQPSLKGDGSDLDLADKHFAELKSHGLFVMFASLTGTIPYEPLYQDGSFISGGDDWGQWKEAMQVKGVGNSSYEYIFVDDRLQKIKMQHAKNLLTHVNPYTGKAYGEEENIAIYEIFNENGLINKILGGELKNWPPYFKDKLQKRWNQWLLDRYINDDGLKKAWGRLDDGESLAGSSVQPGPDFEARLRYPEQRADDYVHFVVDLYNAFNQNFRAYCRSLFPQNIGVNVVPFSFDTLFRPDLPWAYGESLGDIFSDGMYYWDLKSLLDKPPSSYLIDSFTPDKMPVVLYETNIGRPNPYRSEYPIKLAALASYQDWDGVFWHYWSEVKSDDQDNLPYLTAQMLPPMSYHYWTAVHQQGDPVMCATMALAGRIFLGGYIPPAEAPQTIKAGSAALYSYSHFRGVNLARETFTQGSRIEFKPDESSDLTEDGMAIPVANRLKEAVASGKYITWDWPNGRLIIDAPDIKAYVGTTEKSFRYSDGITFGDVSTPWVTFVMASADGKPLSGPQATAHILMGAVFDAKETGFSFNYNVLGGPLEQAKAVKSVGHPPVVMDKVLYTVWFPRQLKGTLKSYDFALREIQSKAIVNENRVKQEGSTPFLDELEVDGWGEDGRLPLAEATRIDTTNPTPAAAGVALDDGTGSGPKAADLVCPISGMDWSMNYITAHKFVENSPFVFTTLSPADLSTNVDKTFAMTDFKIGPLWDAVADVAISFHADQMTGIEITFKDPPPMEDLIAKVSALIGDPAEKKLDAQYGTSRIFWKGKNEAPDIVVTESQGIMKMLYRMSAGSPAISPAPLTKSKT